jgi:hypothetical protein
MKVELTAQQEELFQLLGKTINGKYVFFPKTYIKLGNREYEEVDFDKLPEGIKKFIENEKNKK